MYSRSVRYAANVQPQTRVKSQDNRWTALDHRTSQDTQEGTHFHIKREHIRQHGSHSRLNMTMQSHCNSGYFAGHACRLVGDIIVNLGRRALDECPVLGILLGKLLRLSFPALL